MNCYKFWFLISLIALSLVSAQSIIPNSFAAEKGQITFVRNDNIWIANTDGSDQKQLTFSSQDRDPAFSPDGKLIAYTSGHNELTGFGNIYLIPVTGGTPKKLELKGMQGSEHAHFSSDSKSLVFVGMTDVRAKKKEGYDMTYATISISIVNLNTGKIKSIVSTKNVMLNAGYIYSSPSFSPDGKLIAYQHSGSDVSGGFSVIDLKGKSKVNFPKKSTDPTPYWRPLFTSDSKKILCYSPATNEKQTDSIYFIDLSTGATEKISEGTTPTFIENGKAIIFERWINKWSPEANAQSDLWYLELKEGAKPIKIIENASHPSGNFLSIVKPEK
jgi:Tol biopolymer transport system component